MNKIIKVGLRSLIGFIFSNIFVVAFVSVYSLDLEIISQLYVGLSKEYKCARAIVFILSFVCFVTAYCNSFCDVEMEK